LHCQANIREHSLRAISADDGLTRADTSGKLLDVLAALSCRIDLQPLLFSMIIETSFFPHIAGPLANCLEYVLNFNSNSLLKLLHVVEIQIIVL
jgi:hypothetical protein